VSPLPLPEDGTADDRNPGGGLARLVRLGAAAAALALVAFVWQLVASSPGQRLEPTQEVVLLDPDEWLPEPEPPEEVDLPEPEPDESVEIEAIDDMDPLADDLPDAIDDALGLDAEGGAGSDAFGLKAKRGGRSLIDGEGGTGDPMQRFAGYAAGLERTLKRVLADIDALTRATYAVELKLWIDEDGRVHDCALHRTTGDPVLDSDIVTAIGQGALSVARPPDDLPQPVVIRLRVSPRA